jgi:hypothetical protein
MEELRISSKTEYKVIAQRIEEIQDAPADSLEAQELKILTRAIVEYEKRILRTAPDFTADSSARITS